MNESEASRIAAVVNLIRPTWRIGLIMSVLEDARMIHRTYADAMVAMVAMAVDPMSKKPGRIHEPGRWWLTVTAQAPEKPLYRQIGPNDCGICSRPFEHHSALSKLDDHEYEPLHARGKGAGMTPEQRAAIDAAAAEAKKAATAEKEAQKAREVAPVDQVLARHEAKGDAA